MVSSHVEDLNNDETLGLSSQKKGTNHSGVQNHFNKQQCVNCIAYILETIHATTFFTRIISLRHQCIPARWKFPILIVTEKLLLRSLRLSPTPFTQHFPSHCLLFKVSSFYGVPLQHPFYSTLPTVPQTKVANFSKFATVPGCMAQIT